MIARVAFILLLLTVSAQAAADIKVVVPEIREKMQPAVVTVSGHFSKGDSIRRGRENTERNRLP